MDRNPLDTDTRGVRPAFCGGGLPVAKKVPILCALVAAFVVPSVAKASFIVARDAKAVKLGVDDKGVAMVSFTDADVAKIEVFQGWVYAGRYNGIFGRVTYMGQPVHGFGSSNFGVPTDAFGRNLFLDTLNAKGYGSGWRRENSFLAHNPSGAF